MGNNIYCFCCDLVAGISVTRELDFTCRLVNNGVSIYCVSKYSAHIQPLPGTPEKSGIYHLTLRALTRELKNSDLHLIRLIFLSLVTTGNNFPTKQSFKF